MKTHTLENLVERNAGVDISPTQFSGQDARLDKKPTRIGDRIDLETKENVTIRVVVESIDAGKIVGRISSFCGIADDGDEYMGAKENNLLAFEEKHILGSTRI